MPSGLWNPEMTPSAESSASRLPDTIVIGTPMTFSARAMNSRPLLASRQAAVAIANCLPTRMPPHERAKAHQRRERLVDGVLGEQPGREHLAAEAGEHLFVEDRRQAAGQPLVDDEADRVRADVDDRHRRAVVDAALRERPGAARHLIQGRAAA